MWQDAVSNRGHLALESDVLTFSDMWPGHRLRYLPLLHTGLEKIASKGDQILKEYLHFHRRFKYWESTFISSKKSFPARRPARVEDNLPNSTFPDWCQYSKSEGVIEIIFLISQLKTYSVTLN